MASARVLMSVEGLMLALSAVFLYLGLAVEGLSLMPRLLLVALAAFNVCSCARRLLALSHDRRRRRTLPGA